MAESHVNDGTDNIEERTQRRAAGARGKDECRDGGERSNVVGSRELTMTFSSLSYGFCCYC